MTQSFGFAGSAAAITGAASGIGRALAFELAARSCDLALCDLDFGQLEAVAAEVRSQHGRRVSVHRVDVSDLAQVEAYSAAAIAEFPALNLVINNAGVALLGDFDEYDHTQMEWLMGINFWGVVYGTRAFLPHLERQAIGHIVNLSSIFGIIGPPGQSAYSASKFAVRGFSESLRHELVMKKSGVRLSVVHPGGISTNIARSARAGEGLRVRVSADEIGRQFREDGAHHASRGCTTHHPRHRAERVPHSNWQRRPLAGLPAAGAAGELLASACRHIPEIHALKLQMNISTGAPVAHRSFAALDSRDFRIFLCGGAAAMMADNIEHVITYWMLFQKFHSPALGAVAVVSHWVPYLFLGGLTGALADRFDIRRLIQISMAMFSCVSIGWGVMFLTDSTEIWKAVALLCIHGLAGVIWSPASQLLIHKIVSVDELASAVRLNATGRYLAFLLGPAVGAGLLWAFGPTFGIFINAAIYVPLFVWLIKAPYGPRDGLPTRPAQGIRGFGDIFFDRPGHGTKSDSVVGDVAGRRFGLFRRQRLSGADARLCLRLGTWTRRFRLQRVIGR